MLDQAKLTNLFKKIGCFAIALLLIINGKSAFAQGRNYGLIYSDNIKGGSTIFGNTLMHIVDASTGVVNTTSMNDNSVNGNGTAGNGFSNMQPVDIDGNTGTGAATKNSSSANLLLPAGNNTIKLARLYWGGRNVVDTNNLALPTNKTVKIRKGTSGDYTEYAALLVDTISKDVGLSTNFQLYQAYTDITAFIQQNGAGTYTVGNIPLVRGDGGGTGNFGGWSILVVYENNAVDFNSVRVYDGFAELSSDQIERIVTLTGLDVPSGTLSLADARMSVVTWEGDANISNDYFKINGNTFSNTLNAATNPWNGTITNDGVHVTTKNPNYTNQMGIDIDQFNVGTGFGILPNATSVQLEFGTEQDRYLPSTFAFVIKMKQPTITLGKFVSDANNNNSAEAGEVLTYRLKGKNLGPGNANGVIVTDTLPNTITYLPNSLRVNYCPGIATGVLTDANADDNGEYIVNGNIKSIQLRLGVGSNGTVAGTLAALDSFDITFKATVNTPPSGQSIPPIINIARMKALSQSLISYVDDGIAILNPQGGPVPILLSNFIATQLENNQVAITWQTQFELNTASFVLERSADNMNYTALSTIQAAGISNSIKNYQYTDQESLVNKGIIYYRLKQIDKDNSFTYSKIVAVRLKKANGAISILPNPFSKYLFASIFSSSNELATIKIYSAEGKEIATKNIYLSKGNNTVLIDNIAQFPSGAYIFKCFVENRVETIKLLKN